jgi:hypothetical protein
MFDVKYELHASPFLNRAPVCAAGYDVLRNAASIFRLCDEMFGHISAGMGESDLHRIVTIRRFSTQQRGSLFRYVVDTCGRTAIRDEPARWTAAAARVV